MTSLSIAEASLALGISQDTVRKRIKAGEIPAEKVKAPGGFRWMITVDPDGLAEATPPDRPEGEDSPNGQGEVNPPPTGHIDGLAEIYQARIDDLKTELEARTREISELHQLLAARSLNSGTTRPWWRFFVTPL